MHGGHVLYRTLLDGILAHVQFANAADWLELLALQDEALDWTTNDKSNLAIEFKTYCESGIAEDGRNCSTVDEMNDLIGSLTDLAKGTGINFSYDIGLLSESIAELEEERPALAEGGDIPSGTSFSVPLSVVVVTDDDVRQMFSTLKDELTEG